MASLKLLTSTCLCIKNKQICILKYQKSLREAQFCQVKNAFNTTHSDSERKSLLFFWLTKTSKSMKMHSNSCLKWIMKSVLLQLGSNWASLWVFKKAYKTCTILLICSKRPQNDVIQILEFSTCLSNIMKWPPRAPAERPETPREAFDSPDKHQNQCHWTQNHVKFIGFHRILWISLDSIGFYGFHCIP